MYQQVITCITFIHCHIITYHTQEDKYNCYNYLLAFLISNTCFLINDKKDRAKNPTSVISLNKLTKLWYVVLPMQKCAGLYRHVSFCLLWKWMVHDWLYHYYVGHSCSLWLLFPIFLMQVLHPALRWEWEYDDNNPPPYFSLVLIYLLVPHSEEEV